MSFVWPMAAQAWRAANSSGRVLRPSTSSPAATAPLETIRHSCPAPTSSATSEERRRNCRSSRVVPLGFARIPDPNLRTMRMRKPAEDANEWPEWKRMPSARDEAHGNRHSPRPFPSSAGISMTNLRERIQEAGQAGHLLESSVKNALQLLDRSQSEITEPSIAELLDVGHWEELNDRFFKTLVFGTGGLRGRTIGKVVTAAEHGNPQPLGRPEFPCIGTNAMNYYNISRATQGLVLYIKSWLESQGSAERPKIAVAHDTRHFSRQFAELTAKVAMDLGCDVCLFAGPRSTPQLSFAVRQQNAHAGIVITASHNPPH